jgi:negative regulator of flagellin synthesis FlgM
MKISDAGRILNIYKQNTNINKNNNAKKSVGDRIEISKEVREIAKYIEVAKNTEIKNKRVDEIKEQISKGIYKVDSEKLAKSILNSMKERDI